MKNFTVQFFERNAVMVDVQAETKEEAVKIVQDMLEEGLDFESPSVQVEYSDTQNIFTVYQD